MLVSVLLLVMFVVLTMVRSYLMVVFRIDCRSSAQLNGDNS